MPPTDVLFVADPAQALNPTADTTYVMITEALRRGHRPWLATLDGVALEEEQAWARAVPVTVEGEGGPVAHAGDAARRPMAEFGVVLMRKDPPFDADYLTATWILDRAATLVLNHPAGLRHANEKLSIHRFPHLTPRTRILRRADDLHRTLADFGGKMVVKPVYGFGGRAVLVAREDDANLNAIFELATHEGATWTVAQEFVPGVSEGDKRIVMIDGVAEGAVLRVATRGEARSNFHVGGVGVKTTLSEDDRRICEEVGPFLREHGLYFAGIDVIGGRLTEINVTSPTGMQEINRLDGLSGDDTMQARFWAGIERRM